jgi:hypothetical protein
MYVSHTYLCLTFTVKTFYDNSTGGAYNNRISHVYCNCIVSATGFLFFLLCSFIFFCLEAVCIESGPFSSNSCSRSCFHVVAQVGWLVVHDEKGEREKATRKQVNNTQRKETLQRSWGHGYRKVCSWQLATLVLQKAIQHHINTHIQKKKSAKTSPRKEEEERITSSIYPSSSIRCISFKITNFKTKMQIKIIQRRRRRRWI